MRNLFIFSFENNNKYGLKIKHILSFVIFFCTVAVCLELVNREIIVKRSALNYRVIDSFEKNKDKIETLFLGDSHFAAGIDTDIFKDIAFNLSFGGLNYIQAYYLLRYYIEDMPELKIVALPLDLHSFSSFRSGVINETFFWNRYIDYGDLSKRKGIRVWLKKLNLLTIFDRSLGGDFFMNNIKVLVKNVIFRKRWSIVNSQKLKDSKEVIVFGDRVYKNINTVFRGQDVFDEDLCFYFEKILRLCKDNNVILVTLQMPASHEYITAASEYVTNNELKSRILGNPAYSKYIYDNLDCLTIYDSQKDFFICKYSDSDGYHLNRQARGDFSKLVYQYITKIKQQETSKFYCSEKKL